MFYFDEDHQHFRSYFLDLASGSDFHPDDLADELRIDSPQMSSSAMTKVRDLTNQTAEEVKTLREAGHLQDARMKAEAAAHEVAQLVGDRLVSKRKRKLPDSPRALAALIRRMP